MLKSWLFHRNPGYLSLASRKVGKHKNVIFFFLQEAAWLGSSSLLLASLPVADWSLHT